MAADTVRAHDGVQPGAARLASESVGADATRARTETKRAERTTTTQSRQSALARLERELATLDKPWTVLRETDSKNGGRALGVSFVGLHPEKGIALIDIEPSQPSHAVTGLRVALIRADNAFFTVREPPVVPLVLSDAEIPDLMSRIEAAFAEVPRCAIQKVDWPELAIASLMAEHAQLALLERRPAERQSKTSPAAASTPTPQATKPEAPQPIKSEKDAPLRGKGAGNPQEPRPLAVAPHRTPGFSGEAPHLVGAGVYPPLLRRPDIALPRMDLSHLDVSRMMRSLRLPRIRTPSGPEQSRPEEREKRRPSATDIRDRTSEAPARLRDAGLIAAEPMFDSRSKPSSPQGLGRGRERSGGWTIAATISAMLAALVTFPPEATGPAPSSNHSAANAFPEQHAVQSEPAAEPPRFAMGDTSGPSGRPPAREPPSQQQVRAPMPPPTVRALPAPLTVETEPTAAAAARREPAITAPSTTTPEVARKPPQRGATTLAKAVPESGARDRASRVLTKPAQQKPRPASAPSSSSPRKPTQKYRGQAEVPHEASGGLEYVEGRGPHVLGTLSSPAKSATVLQADREVSPDLHGQDDSPIPLSPATARSIASEGIMAPSGVARTFDPEVRRDPRGQAGRPIPLSPTLLFSITPKGIVAPSGTVRPFDHQ